MGLTSLFLEMKDKIVLIVGTGSVGIRRARRFLDAEACVKIVTRDIDEDIKNEFVEKGARFYDDDMLDDLIEECDLVVVATDDLKLNEEISLKARDKLVNCSSDITLSNVIVPSTFRIGSVTVSLYTDSKSPLMAKELRKKIQNIITPEDILHIEFQEYIRKLLKEQVANQADRKKYMIMLNDDEIIKNYLKEDKLEQAQKYASNIIKNI